MNNLIVGCGEIGQAIGALLESQKDATVAYHDPQASLFYETDFMSVEVLHVCFPYTKHFVKSLQQYIEDYNPEHIIIYSTVPIGITKGFPKAVHSPVEGKHPHLEESIRLMERWIGFNDISEGDFFAAFFRTMGLGIKLVASSDFTEALKLLSTTEYGINIEFARYKARIAEEVGMDYSLTQRWNEEYNRLYKNLGLEKRFQKYVLDAPTGPKGGHCVVPNALILSEQFPSILADIVGEAQ